jgi:hypothetical protein
MNAPEAVYAAGCQAAAKETSHAARPVGSYSSLGVFADCPA